jgi:hypothetical protein
MTDNAAGRYLGRGRDAASFEMRNRCVKRDWISKSTKAPDRCRLEFDWPVGGAARARRLVRKAW